MQSIHLNGAVGTRNIERRVPPTSPSKSFRPIRSRSIFHANISTTPKARFDSQPTYVVSHISLYPLTLKMTKTSLSTHRVRRSRSRAPRTLAKYRAWQDGELAKRIDYLHSSGAIGCGDLERGMLVFINAPRNQHIDYSTHEVYDSSVMWHKDAAILWRARHKKNSTRCRRGRTGTQRCGSMTPTSASYNLHAYHCASVRQPEQRTKSTPYRLKAAVRSRTCNSAVSGAEDIVLFSLRPVRYGQSGEHR